MRLTLREYLDKWYELDRDYDKKWEITVWYVKTAGMYTIYQNQTDKRLYDKYVRNDNRKCWFKIGGGYTPEDNAIYVFVEDEPTDDPKIPMFEIFKKSRLRKGSACGMRHVMSALESSGTHVGLVYL